MRRPAREASGQATVELVGMLPLVVSLCFAVFQLLAAGAAREAADGAAEAGAIALLQGRDAKQAATSALEGWARRRSTVEVRGREITVRVVPRGPVAALTRALAADGKANAGPEAEA